MSSAAPGSHVNPPSARLPASVPAVMLLGVPRSGGDERGDLSVGEEAVGADRDDAVSEPAAALS